ncbi:hypothetical protein [Rothia nasimurium]|uniref:hypothetical protein n=1 Tax=Rothia nasimurium TaxID=85336 RepID=UPI001F33EB9E|nr:hypothetical protein [Rothia nasimurium]
MSHPLTATAEDITLRFYTWLIWHPKTKTALIISAICTLCTFINLETARAEDGTATTMYLPVGHITDSHDVPLSAYSTLPLDNGNLTHPMRSARAFILNILWSIYYFATLLLTVTVDFILGLTWLNWLLSPLFLLATSVQVVTAKLIIIPTALTLSALAGAILWMRGHKTTALIEVLVALCISAFALSPLANPVTYLQGDNGALQQSAQYGNELSQSLLNEENTSSPISASVIDVAIRIPAQIISFGKNLDGECATTYNDMLIAGDTPEDIRKAINSCDEEAKANNETDSFLALAFFIVFAIGFQGLWLIVTVLLFFILKDSFFAAGNAINVIWRSVLAVMPWGTRYGLYNSFTQMWVNILAVGLYIALTAVYLWLYARFTELTGGTYMIYQNFFLGIIALVMVFTLFKMKKNGKSLGEQLSKRLSKLGVTKDPGPRQPSRLANGVKTIAKTAGGYYAMNNMNKGFTRTGTITTAARLGATALTGGTATLATTAATTFAQNMGTAAAQHRLNGTRARAALQPSYRNGDGSIPMPAKTPQHQPAAGTIETPKNTPSKDLIPAPKPATPQAPTPQTPTPKNSPTITPGRYGNVRLDHQGKPHTIKPIEGEIVDIPDSKLRTLKLLDSYDAPTHRSQPRRFNHL